ncbi:MAG: right-handed parallel beta-helix repeat-containing protein [Candidatus Omnitrophota bacterium]
MPNGGSRPNSGADHSLNHAESIDAALSDRLSPLLKLAEFLDRNSRNKDLLSQLYHFIQQQEQSINNVFHSAPGGDEQPIVSNESTDFHNAQPPSQPQIIEGSQVPADSISNLLEEKKQLQEKLRAIKEKERELERQIEAQFPVWTAMFVDLCDSSHIFSTMGDIVGQEIVDLFRKICLDQIHKYHPCYEELSGGDQILVCFENSKDCVDAAIDAFMALAKYNGSSEPQQRKGILIQGSAGIYRGKINWQEKSLMQCHALNYAKRLQDKAGRSQIFISESIRDELAAFGRYTTVFQGVQILKNIPQPQTIYELRWSKNAILYPRQQSFTTFPESGAPLSSIDIPASPSPADTNYEIKNHWPAQVENVRLAYENFFADYSTIAEALSLARENSVISIRPGRYHESIILSQMHDITIESHPDGTVIVESDSGIPLEINNCSNIHISGFTFQSNDFIGDKHTCIFIDRSQNITCEKCKVIESPSLGMNVQFSQNILILESDFRFCGYGGVMIKDFSEVRMERCQVTQNGEIIITSSIGDGCGVIVTSQSSLEIMDCEIKNNRGSGVFADNALSINATGNAIENNGRNTAQPGILFTNDSWGKLNKNQINKNGSAGLMVRESQVHAIGNSLKGNGKKTSPMQSGIVLVDSPKCKLLFNQMTGNGVDVVKKFHKQQAPTPKSAEKPLPEPAPQDIFPNAKRIDSPLNPTASRMIRSNDRRKSSYQQIIEEKYKNKNKNYPTEIKDRGESSNKKK